MPKVDEKLISKLEKLAKIRLMPEEKVQIAGDLESIIEMFDKLREVDTEGVAPLQHMMQHVNKLREDSVRGELSNEEALSNVPEKRKGFIAVPKFLKPE